MVTGAGDAVILVAPAGQAGDLVTLDFKNFVVENDMAQDEKAPVSREGLEGESASVGNGKRENGMKEGRARKKGEEKKKKFQRSRISLIFGYQMGHDWEIERCHKACDRRGKVLVSPFCQEEEVDFGEISPTKKWPLGFFFFFLRLFGLPPPFTPHASSFPGSTGEFNETPPSLSVIPSASRNFNIAPPRSYALFSFCFAFILSRQQQTMSSSSHPLRKPLPPGGSLLGTSILTVGRLADIGVQYCLLRDGAALPARLLGVPATMSPGYGQVLLGMFSVASLRHIYWGCVMNQNDMVPGMAVGVVLFNTVFNTVTSFVSLWHNGGQVSLESPTLWAGVALFVGGMLIELVYEEQRKAFKKKPQNKGRPYTQGLGSWVQHPNYFGYTLWRTGILLTTGSITAAAVGFTWNAMTFLGSSIPELQAHNIKKYGDEYREYTRRTAKLFPFIW